MRETMRRLAQTMEAKWKLKAPDVFTSDVVEMAPADDADKEAKPKDKPKQTDLRG